MRKFIVLSLLLIAAFLVMGDAGAKELKSRPTVYVHWNGLKIPIGHTAALMAPGEERSFKFSADDGVPVKVKHCGYGGYCKSKESSITWRAPDEPGTHWMDVALEIGSGSESFKKTATVGMLVGFASAKYLKNGEINGFEIGHYPDKESKHRPDYYKAPKYFYRMDYDTIGLRLSEHISLGDLGYDHREELPQYFALDVNLVKKLEAMLAELEARGLPARYQYIGGGFISPRSNIKRTATNGAASSMSRHMWGEAVDFIIDDDPRDGVMDDLNRDGVVDVRDAFYMRDLITDLEKRGACVPGGVGVYSPPRNSRIQLHVDVRGFPTRWGYKTYDPEEFSDSSPRRSMRPGG